MKFIAYCLAIGIALAWFLYEPPVLVNQQRVSPERDSAYVAFILDSFAPVANQYDDISHFSLDGSILNAHYPQPVERFVYQEHAKMLAERFSELKASRLRVSGVTVRAVHDGRVMAQADARGGKVTGIQ